MAGVKLTNNASSAFAGSVSGVQATITVTPGEGAKFPALGAGDWFPITGVKPSGQLEIMRCTGRAGDVLTVSRAQEGTAALTFNAGELVYHSATAAALAAIKVEARNEAMPVGGIIMFDPAETLPGGVWSACDGTAGTPDLRDKFIIVAGAGHAAGTTGGATNKTSTASGAHTPSGTVAAGGAHDHGAVTGSTALTINQLPPHDHKQGGGSQLINPAGSTGGISNGFSGGIGQVDIASVGGGQGHTHAITAAADHTHGLTMNAVADHTHSTDVTPPYYALIFLKKIAA